MKRLPSVKASTWLYWAKFFACVCYVSVIAGLSVVVIVFETGIFNQKVSTLLAITIFVAIHALIFGSLCAIIAEMKIDQGERK